MQTKPIGSLSPVSEILASDKLVLEQEDGSAKCLPGQVLLNLPNEAKPLKMIASNTPNESGSFGILGYQDGEKIYLTTVQAIFQACLKAYLQGRAVFIKFEGGENNPVDGLQLPCTHCSEQEAVFSFWTTNGSTELRYYARASNLGRVYAGKIERPLDMTDTLPQIGENGNWFVDGEDTGVPAQGADGRSAYDYAQGGGYIGTEAQFSKKLASGTLYVSVVQNVDTGVITCSNTVEEIATAFKNGTPVYAAFHTSDFSEYYNGSMIYIAADEVDVLAFFEFVDTDTFTGKRLLVKGSYHGANDEWSIASRTEPPADGKSAYKYAQEGGYSGTEEEFSAKLAKDTSVFYIGVTGNETDGYTLSRTGAEIEEAYREGRSMCCNLEIGSDANSINNIPLVGRKEYKIESPNGAISYKTVYTFRYAKGNAITEISFDGGLSDISVTTFSGAFSPDATVTQTETGAVISITDANGTTTATITNGKDGAAGAKGDKGDKGDTGAAGPQGEKGAKGDTGAQGIQGIQGDPGAAGADGFSPTATVTKTEAGAVISITDKNGTTTATVANGMDGYNPVKYKDYYTDADKTEMVNLVLAALPTWNGGDY